MKVDLVMFVYERTGCTSLVGVFLLRRWLEPPWLDVQSFFKWVGVCLQKTLQHPN